MAVTLIGNSIVAQFNYVNVQFSVDVLKLFDAHRQTGWFSKETGGQLFAEVSNEIWNVVVATGPRLADRRGRFHFWPDRNAEQKEIYQHYESGLMYVGDWHTHPEKHPTPSQQDLLSIANVVKDSTFYTSGLLLCIVGLAPFPKGLHVSFHA